VAKLTKSELVPIIMIAVTLLFFFPAAHGGFQASHGPTTTMRESIECFLLLVSMVLCARIVFSHVAPVLLMSVSELGETVAFPVLYRDAFPSLLRC
jgi:hypothetical protein